MSAGFSTGRFTMQVQLAVRAALNLLFPPRCAGCGRIGAVFCQTCAASLVRVGATVCEICGEPLAKPGKCADCQAAPRSFRRVRSAFLYEGPLRHAIHAFKYDRRKYLAEPLGRLMAGALEIPANASAICAVPIHSSRRVERGFNQSHELAKQLSAAWMIPCLNEDGFHRTRPTPPQVGLDRVGRKANVAGAFEVVDAESVRGCVMVVVDDVCTTGATLDACADALLASGALLVEGVTLTR